MEGFCQTSKRHISKNQNNSWVLFFTPHTSSHCALSHTRTATETVMQDSVAARECTSGLLR